MLPDEPPDVLAVGAGLAPEAGRVGDEPLGQDAAVEDLVPVEARQWHLGRRDEVPVKALELEQVLLEPGKVPGPGQRLGVGHERRQDLGETSVTRVEVQHEADEGPLQPGALVHVDGEARARDLGRPLEVQDAQALADVPVGLGVEIEVRRRPPAPDFPIVFGAASDGNGFMRDVRDIEQGLPDLLFDGLEALVEAGDLVADLPHLQDPGRGVRAFLFHPGDLLGGLVLLRPELLDREEDVLLLPGGPDEVPEVDPLAPRPEPILNEIKMFQDILRV
jgi:hypothetical protein